MRGESRGASRHRSVLKRVCGHVKPQDEGISGSRITAHSSDISPDPWATAHCCVAFLHAILEALPAIQHSLDCHAAQLSYRLTCSPRHLVQISRQWPVSTMDMVCHWHLLLQHKRLFLTRAWYLIASQCSGVTHGFWRAEAVGNTSCTQAPNLLHPPAIVLAPAGQLPTSGPANLLLGVSQEPPWAP